MNNCHLEALKQQLLTYTANNSKFHNTEFEVLSSLSIVQYLVPAAAFVAAG